MKTLLFITLAISLSGCGVINYQHAYYGENLKEHIDAIGEMKK